MANFLFALGSISMVLIKINEVNRSTRRLTPVPILLDSMGTGSDDQAIWAPAFGTR